MGGIDREQYGQDYEGYKPPTLPNRRKNGELKASRCRAGDAIHVQRANQKPVTSRAQAGEINRALLRRHSPTLIGALQHVLIVKRLSGTKSQTDKIDLYLVAVRLQRKSPRFSFSQL